MKLTTADIARMIDLSAVRAEDNDEYIESLVACANKYRCIAVFPLPSRVPLVRELLGPNTEMIIGGAVGFPWRANNGCQGFRDKRIDLHGLHGDRYGHQHQQAALGQN